MQSHQDSKLICTVTECDVTFGTHGLYTATLVHVTEPGDTVQVESRNRQIFVLDKSEGLKFEERPLSLSVQVHLGFCVMCTPWGETDSGWGGHSEM